MNLDKKALAGFIQEIEDSRTRQKGETEFQRDVFKRAKEKQFDVKALRIVLQRRAMETTRRDEQDYNVHAYELALGVKKDAIEAMEQGATAREAARRFHLPRAAVTALKPGTENEEFEPAHDSETGEHSETADLDTRSLGSDEGTADVTTASALVAADNSAAPEEATLDRPQSEHASGSDKPAPDGEIWAGTNSTSCGGTCPTKEPETDRHVIGHPTGPQDPITDDDASAFMEAARAKLDALKRARGFA